MTRTESFVAPYPESVTREHYASGFWSETLLLDQLHTWAQRGSDRIALVDGEVRTSYQQLVASSEQSARWLSSLGVGRGDVVAVQLPNSAHLVITILGLLRLGAVYLPINPAYRESDVARILEILPPKVYLYPRSFGSADYDTLVETLASQADRATQFVGLDLDVPFSVEAPSQGTAAESLFQHPHPDDLFLLGSTSGSTGEPKLYGHSQNTQFGEARMLNDVLAITSADVFLVSAPMTHRGALMVGFLMSLAAGATLVILRHYDVGAAVRLIETEGVTTFFAIPTNVLDLLAESARTGARCASLRRLMLAGAPVHPELVDLIRERWPECVPVTGYGASEGGFSTATRLTDPPAVLQTCGAPLPGQQVAISNPDEITGEGEIVVRGAFLFRGYVSADQTRESIADGWFKTGDLGRIDIDGNLRVTGRLKNVIIRAGMKISAEEVEDTLLRHPSVAEAVVVGTPHARLGEQTVACIVTHHGAQFSSQDLRELFEASGSAKFKWPELLICLPSIPKNAVGKQDRNAVKAALPSLRPTSVREQDGHGLQRSLGQDQ